MPSAAGGSAPRCDEFAGGADQFDDITHALHRDEVVGHENQSAPTLEQLPQATDFFEGHISPRQEPMKGDRSGQRGGG